MANLARNRVMEDRFYSPPALRRYNLQQQQQQQQKQKQVEQTQLQEAVDLCNSTNLDRFMEHTTPIVPAQRFSKTSMKGWRNRDDDFHPYFILGDLWESLKEWSAYGAGVPLVLNESDSVVQYYVPYLSAIQLYVDPSTSLRRVRRPGEESESDSSRATSSDGSSASGAVEGANAARGSWVPKNNINAVAESFNRLLIRDDTNDEGEISDRPGLLVFEYFEHTSPFHRAPLADKISMLASEFPELKTYRSCDLTPSSWVSVAWYPIYRIPVGPSLQNVDACFLTFHSLSTPLQRTSTDWQGSTAREVDSAMMQLPIFGLAAYKFKVSDWIQGGAHGCQKANSLLRAADNWLRLLNVSHPDFGFFLAHSSYWR